MLNLLNCTIFYVKWPISNNFVTVIILESFHVSPIDDGHFRLLEGFFDGCSIPFSFFFFMANRETQCCIFDTTDVREKYMARFFFKPMIWANKMLNIVLSVLTINNAKAGGIVSRTFNTVSAVQDFGYCGL